MKIISAVISVVLCLILAENGVSATAEQRLTVTWNVLVTTPGGGHLNWYELKADPEDDRHLIVCGAERNAQDNAYYGVVYSSSDGGRSWKMALEDRSSAWVSEQSCTFGPQQTAYFISEASRVIDGEPHHALGTTRIFVSSDGGQRWRETAKTGWADYSSSVVGTSGSGSPRLYVFYNGNAAYDPSKKRGSSLDFFTASSDGTRISSRQSVPGMVKKNYQGVYPSSSAVLDDGSVVVLFNARTKEIVRGNRVTDVFQIGVVHVTSRGPLAPVTIADITTTNQTPGCPVSLSNSLAYDKTDDILYAAYNKFASGRCVVMLTHSRDDGRTWAQPDELQDPQHIQSSMYFPVLAVNREGVLGLLWRGRAEKSPGCWFFSISRDGLELESTVPLSACQPEDFLREQSSAYLATFVSQGKAGQPSSVDLVTLRDYLTRVGISAAPNGTFHPLWSALEDGCDELRTARIRIGYEPRSAAALPLPALSDVTDEFTTLYGGEERLDRQTNSVMIDLSFRNNSSRAVAAPLYLKVEHVTSAFGSIGFVNSIPAGQPGMDYIDLSTMWHADSLGPKATTPPVQLIFRFSEEIPSLRDRYFILRFKLRLFHTSAALAR